MMTPIYGGRNNRAYKINLEGKDYFLKHYNKKSDLTRSRLGAEYAFLTYAAECQSPHVTRPVSCDEEKSIGIYEFIEGERYQKDEIGKPEIMEALAFIKDINQHHTSPAAQKLDFASEACFSIAEHIERVDIRVQRLQGIFQDDEIDTQAHVFIQQELEPAWLTLKKSILAQTKKHGLPLNDPLSIENRIISPSDFGFHNALKLQDGKIMFVDFEYSGWDDPAKLIGDFFNQIEVSVPLDYFDFFTHEIAKLVPDSEKMIQRAALLLPLYQIKWCCIILNYFLPPGKINKDFVAPVMQEDRILQLNKAKEILNARIY